MNTPKSLEELKKMRVAEALKNAEAMASKEWDDLQSKHAIRDFVERHGGVKSTLALIENLYGLSASKTKTGKRLKRTTVTGEIRAKIEKLLRENKTAKAVAEAVGVSIPTVNNHKRALGLTKPRSVDVANVAKGKRPKPKSKK